MRLFSKSQKNIMKYISSATSWVHYTTSCNTQSSAPEDRRDHRPKHVELIGIINKPLLLHPVGCLCYLQKELPALLKGRIAANPTPAITLLPSVCHENVNVPYTPSVLLCSLIIKKVFISAL